MANVFCWRLFLLLLLSCLGTGGEVLSSENDIIFDSVLPKKDVNIPQTVAMKIQEATVKVVTFTQGSGVLIRRDLDSKSYTLVTAWHNIKSLGPNEDIAITTYDNKTYYATLANVRQRGDMAWVNFNSYLDYKIPSLVLSPKESKSLQIGDIVIVSGFKNMEDNITLSVGRLLSKAIDYGTDGYGLSYPNRTSSGMSGGGIFDINGRLIGIHGQASKEIRATKLLQSNIKSGISSGMPIFVADKRLWSAWSPPPVHEARNLIQYLESQIDINPSKDLFIALANNYTRLQYHDAAFNSYNSALEYKNEMSNWELEKVYDMRAVGLISLGRFEEAREELDKLIVLQKKHGKPFINSVIMKMSTFPQDQQLKEFEDWILINGTDHLNSLAYIFKSQRYKVLVGSTNDDVTNTKYKKKATLYAAKSVELCLKRPPIVGGCRAAELSYSELLAGIDQNGYERALNIVNKYIDLDPTDPDLYVSRALVHLYGQDFSGYGGGNTGLVVADLFYAKSIEEYHVNANYWINYLSFYTAKKDIKLKSSACTAMRHLQSVLIVDKVSNDYVDNFITQECDQY